MLEEKSILVGHILTLPLPIPAAPLGWVPSPHNQACWFPGQSLYFTTFFHPPVELCGPMTLVKGWLQAWDPLFGFEP